MQILHFVNGVKLYILNTLFLKEYTFRSNVKSYLVNIIKLYLKETILFLQEKTYILVKFDTIALQKFFAPIS